MSSKLAQKELEETSKTLETEAVERKWVQEELSVVYDALNSSVSGVIITNLEGDITYVNSAFLKIFEYEDKREVLNKNAAMLFATDEVRKFSDVQAIIDETRGETEEFEVHRKDGTTLPVEVSSSNVTDHKGRIVGRMASFVDITGRKKAQSALRQSEERYRRITDAITDYIYTVRVQDGQPVETIHRPTCIAVTGHSAEAFKVNPFLWIDMVHEADRNAVQQHADRLLSGAKVEPIEHRIVRKDAAVRWVRNTGVPYCDSERRLMSYDGLVQDITERKLAELALRDSERKYSTLVENSLTGIYIDQDGKITFANSRFASIYGYSREELLGMESWKLVHPEDRAWTNENRARRLRGEEVPPEYEARGLTKDGKTIWIYRGNSVIHFDGRPAILGNIVNVTEQKRAEEELRKINQELKNFVHVVSHDLKTPIISIEGFASRLL
ncbi:MAG: PAS domain S-box protein, partial [Desulfobacterales bacterium]